jgi:ankyrin repeat protein
VKGTLDQQAFEIEQQLSKSPLKIDPRTKDHQERNVECHNHEIHVLKVQLDSVIKRASVCLRLPIEKTRHLLLSIDEKEFLTEKDLASIPIYSSHPAEANGSTGDSLHQGLFDMVSLPPHQKVGAPGRRDYIRIMTDLLLGAITRNSVDDIRLILQKCPKAAVTITLLGETALYVASAQRAVEAVEIILEYTTDLNQQTEEGKSCLHVAKDASVIRMVCEEGGKVRVVDKNGDTPLHCYVSGKLYSCIQEILRYGADCNVENRKTRQSALQLSASLGDYHSLQPLLTDSMVQPKIDKIDSEGNNLLHLVCMAEGAVSYVQKCVMILLDRGVSCHLPNNRGIPPLHYLVGNQSIWHRDEGSKEEVVQLVQLLLAMNVDVNAKDRDGCTALVIACAHRKFDMCKLLLQNRADMNIPCRMNSYMLRRDNPSEEEQLVDGMDCTASDLFPPGRKRAEIFAHISSIQTPISPSSRMRCMNCAQNFPQGFFSASKVNCRMCGRLVCSDCLVSEELTVSDLPSFLMDSSSDPLSSISLCIVCYPILVENFPRPSRQSRGNGNFSFWS